jgi:hypothetical protein
MIKVVRFMEETWQPEYSASLTAKDFFRAAEQNVPDSVWDRLHKAEEELSSAREEIEKYFK